MYTNPKKITYWTKWESNFFMFIIILTIMSILVLLHKTSFLIGLLTLMYVVEKLIGYENINNMRVKTWYTKK